MQKQSLDFAITTADLLADLNSQAPEPKYSLRDLFMTTSQVAVALSLCWALHVII